MLHRPDEGRWQGQLGHLDLAAVSVMAATATTATTTTTTATTAASTIGRTSAYVLFPRMAAVTTMLRSLPLQPISVLHTGRLGGVFSGRKSKFRSHCFWLSRFISQG